MWKLLNFLTNTKYPLFLCHEKTSSTIKVSHTTNNFKSLETFWAKNTSDSKDKMLFEPSRVLLTFNLIFLSSFLQTCKRPFKKVSQLLIVIVTCLIKTKICWPPPLYLPMTPKSNETFKHFLCRKLLRSPIYTKKLLFPFFIVV